MTRLNPPHEVIGRDDLPSDDRSRYRRAIYLCENRAGEVIYIGQTDSWWNRRTYHVRSSPWWRHVQRIHLIDASSSKAERLRDERILIELLQPANNVHGTLRDPRKQPGWGRWKDRAPSVV